MYKTKYFTYRYPSEVHSEYADWLERKGSSIKIISTVSMGDTANLLVTYIPVDDKPCPLPPPPPNSLRPRN